MTALRLRLRCWWNGHTWHVVWADQRDLAAVIRAAQDNDTETPLWEAAHAEAMRRHDAGDLYALTKSRVTTFVEGALWGAARAGLATQQRPGHEQVARAPRTRSTDINDHVAHLLAYDSDRPNQRWCMDCDVYLDAPR